METAYTVQQVTKKLPNGEEVQKAYKRRYLRRAPAPVVPPDEAMPRILREILAGRTRIDIAAEFGISRYKLNKRIAEYLNQSEADLNASA